MVRRIRRTGLKLAVAAALVVAMLVGGTAVVLGAIGSRTKDESLVPPAAHGGPDGRLAVAGPWLQALDPDDAGELAGWAAGHFPGRLVTVPNVANAAKVTGAAGVSAYRGGIAWYRTVLTAPHTGSFALRFESVHHVAQVWLDGQLLGHATPVPTSRSSSRCACARACRIGWSSRPTTASRRVRSARAGIARGSTTAASTAR